MQVNSINGIKQINTQPKYSSKVTFKNANYQADIFESQKKDSKKELNILNIIGGALIVGLSAALIYKHQSLKNNKLKTEALEKAKDKLAEEKSAAEEALKKANEKSEKKVKDLEDKVQELENKIKNIENKEQNVEKHSEKLPQKKEIKADSSKEKVITPTINIDDVATIIGAQQASRKLENRKGLNRIIGYADLKSEVLTKIISPIKSGSDNIPNLVVLYGTKGCGKTTLSKAIREECVCNEQLLRCHSNSQKDLTSLKEAIKKANEKYNENGKHTILYIEEVNGFIKESDKLTQNIINNLAKDNHCTIIATTNYPQRINPNLIPTKGYEEFYIRTATESDIEEILKYYLPVFTDESINYSELVSILKNKGKYSNAKIVSQVKTFLKTKSKPDSKLTQSDFVEFFNSIEPDISKEVIDSYKK